MLGTDKSRGYCLEMICADFPAGANLDSGDPRVVAVNDQIFQVPARRAAVGFSWRPERENIMSPINPKPVRAAGSGSIRAACI